MKTLMGIAVLVIGGMLYAVTPSKVQEQPIASQVQLSAGYPDLDLPGEFILAADATTNQAVDATNAAIRYALQKLEKRPTDGSLLSKPNTQATTEYINGAIVTNGRKLAKVVVLFGCNSNAAVTGNCCITIAGASSGSDLNTNFLSVGRAITLFDASSCLAGALASTNGDPMSGSLGRAADANSAFNFGTALTLTTDVSGNAFTSTRIYGNDATNTNTICEADLDPRGYQYLFVWVRLAGTWGSGNLNRIRVYVSLS